MPNISVNLIVKGKEEFKTKSLTYRYTLGTWGVGLATRRCNLNKAPLGTDGESWVLRQDGCIFHNSEEKSKLPDVPQEGDILVRLAVTCPQVFLLNLFSVSLKINDERKIKSKILNESKYFVAFFS